MTTRPDSPRARYREQTRTEIKEIALRQLAEGGTGSIALTRIAKELGLTSPALYRYFASRDELLTALIRDCYEEAAAGLARAAEASGRRTPRNRLTALAAAFRAFAVQHPDRYLLIAGSPVPGYDAPVETLRAARAVLGPFLGVFVQGRPAPALAPVVRQMRRWAQQDAGVSVWVADYVGADPSPDAVAVAIAGTLAAWTRMHGVVSLEVSGQFGTMGHDPQDLFAAEVATLADDFDLA